MTITLGGITISDNMYLEGIERANPISVKQERTVDGISVLTITPTPGGRSLTLGSSQLGNAIQGIWCQSVIDELKVLQATGDPQVLDYQGTTYNVVIVGMDDFAQMFQFEPVGPNKKYLGKIQLIEV